MTNRIEADRKYTTTHEWVKLEGDVAVVGITDYAQQNLSDLVFIELPALGDYVEKGTMMIALESVKAVGEVFAPLSGRVAAVNSELADNPERLNRDPYGEGWLVKILPGNPAELAGLLDAESYTEFLTSV